MSLESCGARSALWLDDSSVQVGVGGSYLGDTGGSIATTTGGAAPAMGGRAAGGGSTSIGGAALGGTSTGASTSSGGQALGSGGIQIEPDPDQCDPNDPAACRNGGRCIPSGDVSLCECPRGVYGPNCESYVIEATYDACTLSSDGIVRGCRGSPGAPASGRPLFRISTETIFGCGLDPAGHFECWERNGDSLGRNSSIEFVDLRVSAGAGYWGLTRDGELVRLSGTLKTDIALGPGLTSFAVSDSRACGVDSLGVMSCWEQDSDGAWQSAPPFGARGFKEIAGDPDDPWAITEDGQVICPAAVDCLFSTNAAPYTKLNVPPDWAGDFACAIDGKGDVRCNSGEHITGPFDWVALTWEGVCASKEGTHEYVCFPFNPEEPQENPAPTLPPALNVTDVSIASTCFFTLDSEGKIGCWRRLPFTDASVTPPTGSFDRLFTDFSLTCARRASPDLTGACWGSVGSILPSDLKLRDVHPASACALDFDGKLQCFGSRKWAPDVPLSLLSSGSDLCGAEPSGALICLASYSTNTRPRDNDTRQPIEGSFVQISGGDNFNCAVQNDDVVRCWGSDQATMRSPQEKFRQISCSYQTCCGVRQDSTLNCWGPDMHLAARVAGQYSLVRLNGPTLCGIHTDGTLMCRDDLFAL